MPIHVKREPKKRIVEPCKGRFGSRVGIVRVRRLEGGTTHGVG